MSADSKPRGIKPPVHIVPMQFVWDAARALQHGISKQYKRDSWVHAGDEADEYLGSCLRHLLAILDGETHDEENRPHIEGACASLAIFAWHFANGYRVKRREPHRVVVNDGHASNGNGAANGSGTRSDRGAPAQEGVASGANGAS